jgi:hypothetical protein
MPYILGPVSLQALLVAARPLVQAFSGEADTDDGDR